ISLPKWSWFDLPKALVNYASLSGKAENITSAPGGLSRKYPVETIRRRSQQSAVVEFYGAHIDEFCELPRHKCEGLFKRLRLAKTVLYLCLRLFGHVELVQQPFCAYYLRRHLRHEIMHGDDILLNAWFSTAVHGFPHCDCKPPGSGFARCQEIGKQKFSNPIVSYDGLGAVNLLVSGLAAPKVLRE